MVNNADDKQTTVADMANVHLRSCLRVGVAEARSKEVFPFGSDGDTDAKAGRNAWDSDEPTSPKVKQSIATEKRAVCAAAGAPPRMQQQRHRNCASQF
jgi:hypothetical protein